MRIKIVDKNQLAEADRWAVGYFANSPKTIGSVYKTVPLKEICFEVKETVDPANLREDVISYVGLENVRSLTGELVGFKRQNKEKIKSRSKTFRVNDVLYGRLRPELNKVILSDKRIAPGICSNEFIVLRPDQTHVLPIFLRYLLASAYVASYVKKFRSGASLPRLAAADLMSLSVPLPPIDIQEELENWLRDFEKKLCQWRAWTETAPILASDSILEVVKAGDLRPLENKI